MNLFLSILLFCVGIIIYIYLDYLKRVHFPKKFKTLKYIKKKFKK